ncbi:hypothetical protein TNCV_538151 [Trichonephila clavipes]|nr:hypothetical protein TNCV_538151 [Trichonephila clavipes]
MSSILEEGINVCASIMPVLQEGGDFNYLLSHKSSREVGGTERELKALAHTHCVLHQKRVGTEPNRSVTCMVIKAVASNKRKTSP